MKRLTPAQRLVLAFLADEGIYASGLTARQVARKAWPDDAGWDRRTAGNGASGFNGAQGGTLPLRAGRVLSNLADLRTDDGYRLVSSETSDEGVTRWTVTGSGLGALEAK